MVPDFARMDAGTAQALAQVVPVLLLTLLFEIRARPDRPSPRRLAVLIGFIGNLGVAAAALWVEFALLAVVQNDGVAAGAHWIWRISFALFAVVVVRWAAVSAARTVVREVTAPVAAGLSSGLSLGMATAWEIWVTALTAPATLLAEVLATLWSMVGSTFAMMGSALSGMAEAFSDISQGLGLARHAVLRRMSALFRRR